VGDGEGDGDGEGEADGLGEGDGVAISVCAEEKAGSRRQKTASGKQRAKDRTQTA
jgi:hypothetical protein